MNPEQEYALAYFGMLWLIWLGFVVAQWRRGSR